MVDKNYKSDKRVNLKHLFAKNPIFKLYPEEKTVQTKHSDQHPNKNL